MKDSAQELTTEQRTVCLIEDETDVREIYTIGLTAENLNILTAKDGSDGLALIRAEHPDVILLDLQMPVMNGFEVLRALAEDKSISKIPVIVLSNTDDEEAFRKAGDFNVRFFFIKALVNPRKVAGAIREIFSS